MARSELNIALGLNTRTFDKAIRRVERRLKKFSRDVTDLGDTLTKGITLPLAGLGAASLKAFGDMEKLEKGLAAVSEEGTNAGEELEKLREAAKAPGLAFEQAVRGSIQLQSVGFSADAARRSLSALGKVVALTGDSTNLDVVIKQLTQINSKGRLLAEDLLVIQENAPAIGIALNDAFGTTNVEAIRATGISTQEFTRRLIEAIEQNEKFAKVTGGLSNAFDNLGNDVKFALGELGREITNVVDVQKIFERVSGAINAAVNAFKALDDETKRTILSVAAIAAAAGPLLLALGTLTKSLAVMRVGLVALSGPAGAIIAVLVALGLAVVKLSNEFGGFEEALLFIQAKLNGFVAGAKAVVSDLAGILLNPIKALKAAITGNFKEAGRLLRESLNNAFDGKTAGQLAADAYNKEFEKTLIRGAFKLARQDFEAAQSGGEGADIQKQIENVIESASGFGKIAVAAAPSSPGRAEKEKIDNFSVPLSEAQISQDLGDVSVFNVEEIDAASTAILAYQNRLQEATNAARVFGTTGDLLNEKINITKQALEGAIEQFGINSPQVETLREQYAGLTEQLSQLNAQQERQKNLQGVINAGINAFGQSISQSITAAESFGQAIKSALLTAIDAIIKFGIAEVIKGTLSKSSFLGPFAIPIAAAAGAAASALFRRFVGLAEGGIIPPGFPNDTFPARLSSGEAVIPLDRLPGLMSNEQSVFIPDLRLSGEDLVIAFRRAEKNFDRVS